MSYPSVPTESKSKIDKAAILLSRGSTKPIKTSSDEVEAALQLVNAWRVSHAYPLNTFNVNLRKRVRSMRGAVVAQRLKRMPTILDKLVREPTMELTTMQDLGGVRAILQNPKDVYKIVDRYKASKTHELVDERDYILNPRAKDGYRSYHLVYKYSNTRDQAQQYNGLRIEVQLRTKLEHNWATAVETMGVILGQQLKSRQGERKWLEFFAVVSSAFAHLEGTNLVPGYEHLSQDETFDLVIKKEKALNAREKFSGFSRAMEFVNRDERSRVGRPKNGYYLLQLDKKSGSITIASYTRDDASRASRAYEELEMVASTNPDLDALLVSVGPLDELRKAYPNYFLDVSAFVSQLDKIINYQARQQ